MSRHVLPALTGNEQYKIVVGWDPPLNTFFAQVLYVDDDQADEHGEVLWIGASFNEIHNHETVIDAVRPYAEIPATLAYDIYAEAHA